MTEKSGVPLLRLPVWRIPKRGRVGESCDLSFLPSSGVLLKVAGISRQQKAPMTRRRREGVQVDHSGRSWGSRPGPSHNLRNPLQRRCYFQRFPPTICSSPAAGLPLGVVEMIIARRAQPRVFSELLHLAGRCYSPHSPHPYRNHSNLSVDYDDERGASVTQTASETRRLGLLPFARKLQLFEELFGVGGVSQVHAEDSTALLTLLTNGPISRAPWRIQRVPPINFRPRRTVSISGGPQISNSTSVSIFKLN